MAASIPAACEQKNVIPETYSRPGDVYSPCSSAGQPAALDVIITSPLQPSIISNAMRTSDLRAAEEKMIEHYSQQCVNIGVRFIPMAFQSSGCFPALVGKTLKRIALLTDNRSLDPAGLSVAFSTLAQSVLITLIRGNAIMLIEVQTCEPVARAGYKMPKAAQSTVIFYRPTRGGSAQNK